MDVFHCHKYSCTAIVKNLYNYRVEYKSHVCELENSEKKKNGNIH